MAARIRRVRNAGPDHQVLTVDHTGHRYRRRPCAECPWRIDTVGGFPPEAFVHSASTSYDVPDTVKAMVTTGEEPSTFACHMTGADKPATCAGFLLRGAAHNLAVRMAGLDGRHFRNIEDGGVALHANYRAMAVANGVAPGHPALRACRDDAERRVEDEPAAKSGRKP